MTFDHAWVLAFVPLYLIVELIIYYRIRSKAAPLPTAGFIRAFTSWRTRAIRILRFLPPVAIVLLLFAISSPESVQSTTEVLPSGINIMVVLDISGSMAAEDFQPLNRLEGAKAVLRDFIHGRRSDRIGLVVFGGRSVTRSPLTLQHETLQQTLKSVAMGELPEGTAIGMAIMSGINRLMIQEEGSRKGDRIMILITDGRNNGEIHPFTAVDDAKKYGIKIYTIGVGGFGPAPYPTITPEGKKAYRYEKADLDEDLLKAIAARTGGNYFRASDAETLSLLFRQIDRLEKSEPQILETQSVRTRAQAVAIPVLLLGICYAALTLFIVRLP
ncbi:VWA domain-containing protein [bacterium]|nr:VWA domain-containing protein [bacterium]